MGYNKCIFRYKMRTKRQLSFCAFVDLSRRQICISNIQDLCFISQKNISHTQKNIFLQNGWFFRQHKMRIKLFDIGFAFVKINSGLYMGISKSELQVNPCISICKTHFSYFNKDIYQKNLRNKYYHSTMFFLDF